MNLQQLRYFRALAKTGHFGNAAKQLFITQPALSNSISKLEAELGFALFERTKSGATLTALGIEFDKHISVALKEIDEAMNIMGPDAIQYSPTIRLGMVASVENEFIPRLLSTYTSKTRRIIDFDMHEQRTTFQCANAVKDGKLDLAFCGRLPKEESLAWVPVCAQDACIAVNVNHPLAERRAVSLKELESYPLISYRDSSYMHYTFKSLLDEHGLNFTQAFSVETNGAARVLADARVVALMLNTIDGGIKDYVRLIPIKEVTGPFHMVGMVFNGEGDHSEETGSFIDFVQERYKELQAVTPYEERFFELY